MDQGEEVKRISSWAAIHPNFPRPLYYGVLNAPYFIISSLLTSIIVTLIR